MADFGIARAVTSTTQTFSPNSIMGSVHYFSPEQAKGKLATEQSDLYSLGIVFYEMLTKKLPFDGESPISIALKHLQQTIPPASQYNLNVTPKLQGILDKMLEKDRSLRYQNATELLAALRTWNVPGEDTAATNESENELDQESQHTQIYTPVNPDKKPLKTCSASCLNGELSLSSWPGRSTWESWASGPWASSGGLMKSRSRR